MSLKQTGNRLLLKTNSPSSLEENPHLLLKKSQRHSFDEQAAEDSCSRNISYLDWWHAAALLLVPV